MPYNTYHVSIQGISMKIMNHKYSGNFGFLTSFSHLHWSRTAYYIYDKSPVYLYNALNKYVKLKSNALQRRPFKITVIFKLHVV